MLVNLGREDEIGKIIMPKKPLILRKREGGFVF
jgi:hypothetical protein